MDSLELVTKKDITIYYAFAMTLILLQENQYISRKSWQNEGMYIYLVPERIDDRGIIAAEFRHKNSKGIDCSWTPTHEEMLAKDYYIIKNF